MRREIPFTLLRLRRGNKVHRGMRDGLCRAQSVTNPCLTSVFVPSRYWRVEWEQGTRMTSIGAAAEGRGSLAGFLDKSRIIAGAGFNRWLVPPAALAIHLCIGMAYGFSVFWLPLSRSLGHDKSIVCNGMGLGQALFTTT